MVSPATYQPVGIRTESRRDAIGGWCRRHRPRLTSSRRVTTTFTASQGLLLMLPNMYKIAGELTASACMWRHARSPPMRCRSSATTATSWRAGTLALPSSPRAPCKRRTISPVSGKPPPFDRASRCFTFLMDFRTSHEISRIDSLDDDDLRFMIDDELVAAHRHRALTPDQPTVRGTAQNPDTFFQAREACNPFYDACPQVVQESMDRFSHAPAGRTALFEYVGHPKPNASS